jgi:hypothetical protein
VIKDRKKTNWDNWGNAKARSLLQYIKSAIHVEKDKNITRESNILQLFLL